MKQELNLPEQLSPILEKKPVRTISRRSFLKGLAAVAATVVSPKIDQLLNIFEPNKSAEATSGDVPISPEQMQQLREIVEYREAIGLSGFPDYFTNLLNFDVSQNNEQYLKEPVTEWPACQDEIGLENISGYNLSYAWKEAEVVRTIFGEKTTHFLRKIFSDGGNENYFAPLGRGHHLPENAHQAFPSLNNYLGNVLHESIGHSTDPGFYVTDVITIPYDVLISIEHGKWKALSQAFNVEGEFFHHEGDQMLNQIKMRMGRDISYDWFINRNFDNITGDATLANQLAETMMNLAGTDSLNNIFFNKLFCRNFGHQVVEAILNNPNYQHLDWTKLRPYLTESYQLYLNDALKEIYAEMVRLSLEPDQTYAPNNNLQAVRENFEVMSGVSEILGAIRGEFVALADLRSDIQETSREIQSKWEQENELLVSRQADNSSSEQEVQNTSDSDLEFQENLIRSIDDFYIGFLPDLGSNHNYSPQELDIIEAYANQLRLIVQIHPSLKNNSSGFDPETMHIWDIEVLAQAADSANIRNLVSALLKNDNIALFIDSTNPYNLQNRTNILRDFRSRDPSAVG